MGVELKGATPIGVSGARRTPVRRVSPSLRLE